MLFNLNVFQTAAPGVQTGTLSMAVNAPVQKVFSMFTDAYKLSKWGAKKLSDRHIRLNNALFIISDEVANTYAEWRFLNAEGVLAYSISFTLIAENDHTLLNFSKQCWGGANSDVPGIDWECLLLILKTECEKQPAKPILKIASIF
jgi:hypothetical protein